MASAKANGAVRWRLCLSQKDFDALKYFQIKMMFGSAVNGIRYALARQAERDAAKAWKLSDAALARIKESSVGMRGKSARHGAAEQGLIQWCAWLNQDDRDHMTAIIKTWVFEQKVEAVRFAIRCQAEIDGFRPEGGW